MARVEPVGIQDAAEKINKMNDEYSHKVKLNNMKRTLLHNTVAFDALNGFHKLCDEAKGFLSELDVNLFCYAISFENDCMVCSAVFKSFLDEQGVDFDTLIMTPVEQALVSFGRNIADNPHEVFEDQIEEMKEFFTDEQLVVLTALAAMMVASNIVNTVLDVEY
ncbi:MAG: hypothetical protein J6B25_00925 [Clostridia bacterium]|nr:hypothetical protein [Clostridia bacterium]